MNSQHNGIGGHEHGMAVTVPDLPVSMQTQESEARTRAKPPPKGGCFASLCSCFSQRPDPVIEKEEQKEEQQDVSRVRNNASEEEDDTKSRDVPQHPPSTAPDVHRSSLNGASDALPTASTVPALENMNASSGDLVLPDTKRSSFTWSIPDKGDAKDSSSPEQPNPPNHEERGRSPAMSLDASKNAAPNGSDSKVLDTGSPSEESRFMESSYSYAGSIAAAGLEDVEMTGLPSGGSRWADLQGYVEIEDASAERVSEGEIAPATQPSMPAPLPPRGATAIPPIPVSGIPPIPARKRSPSPASRPSLPVSKTPMITPMGTPRYFSPQSSPRESHDEGDGIRVLGVDGHPVDCRAVESVILAGIDAVAHCMLVSHWTSTDVGCLLTLKSAPGSAGVALEHAGLQLASRSGSEAATVMSARQCALFRRGLAQALEHVNQRIAAAGVTVKRFQVLREELSTANGLLAGSGELNRRMILTRYRHIVDDMYQHEGKYPHKWMQDLPDLPGGEAAPGGGALNASGSSEGWKEVGRQVTPRGWVGGKEGGKEGSKNGSPPGQPRGGEAGDTPRQADIVAYLTQMAEMRRRNGEDGGAGGGGGNPYNNFGGWTEARAGSGPGHVPARSGQSGQSSPRIGFGGGSTISPRLTHRSGGSQQQRLPQSVRMLSVDQPGSGTNTPRDRGRYSPSFASGNVQPFTKAMNPGILPVGNGPLGLPLGGANFDGAFRSCVSGAPATPVGKPPRPGQSSNSALSKRGEAASLEAIAGKPPVPRPMAYGGGGGSGGRSARGEEGGGGYAGRGGSGIQVGQDGYEVVQTPTGEWAF